MLLWGEASATALTWCLAVANVFYFAVGALYLRKLSQKVPVPIEQRSARRLAPRLRRDASSGTGVSSVLRPLVDDAVELPKHSDYDCAHLYCINGTSHGDKFASEAAGVMAPVHVVAPPYDDGRVSPHSSIGEPMWSARFSCDGGTSTTDEEWSAFTPEDGIDSQFLGGLEQLLSSGAMHPHDATELLKSYGYDMDPLTAATPGGGASDDGLLYRCSDSTGLASQTEASFQFPPLHEAASRTSSSSGTPTVTAWALLQSEQPPPLVPAPRALDASPAPCGGAATPAPSTPSLSPRQAPGAAAAPLVAATRSAVPVSWPTPVPVTPVTPTLTCVEAAAAEVGGLEAEEHKAASAQAPAAESTKLSDDDSSPWYASATPRRALPPKRGPGVRFTRT